jgi:predicted hydrocarbon binding protein
MTNNAQGLIEPFFIQQNADLESDDEVKEWFRSCGKEARSEGAKLFRFSKHPDMNVYLVEAWDKKAYEIGDQGPVRWQFTTQE